VAAETKCRWLVFANEADVTVSFDLLFKSGSPEDAVDEHAAIGVIEDIFGGPLGGVENACLGAVFGGVVSGPCRWYRFFLRVGIGVLLHRNQWLAISQHGESLTCDAVVGAGVTEAVVFHPE